MSDVQYINEIESVDPIIIDYEQIKTEIKPIQKIETEIFRPTLPQPAKPHQQKIVNRKPLQKINKPIDEIVFARYADYLEYKQLYDS